MGALLMDSQRIWRSLATVCAILLFTGCGKGSDPGSSSGNGSPTDQQRVQAATTTAGNNVQCTALTPFYWEIGDKNGVLVSGTGGDNSSTPPSSATVMGIASASKWIFSTYALEKLNISSGNP